MLTLFKNSLENHNILIFLAMKLIIFWFFWKFLEEILAKEFE